METTSMESLHVFVESDMSMEKVLELLKKTVKDTHFVAKHKATHGKDDHHGKHDDHHGDHKHDCHHGDHKHDDHHDDHKHDDHHGDHKHDDHHGDHKHDDHHADHKHDDHHDKYEFEVKKVCDGCSKALSKMLEHAKGIGHFDVHVKSLHVFVESEMSMEKVLELLKKTVKDP